MYKKYVSPFFDVDDKEVYNLKYYLINRITIYSSKKHIQRKDFLLSIQTQLRQNKKLTLKQFDIIVTFLLKDLKIQTDERDLLYFKFRPIIRDFKDFNISNEDVLVKNGYIKPTPVRLDDIFV